MTSREHSSPWESYAARTMELPDLKQSSWFTSRIPPNVEDLLDLGCGTGRYAEAFAMAYPTLKVHAYDPDEYMLNLTKTERKHIHATEKTGVLELKKNHAFDAIWANNSLFFLPQESLSEAFQNISNALKTGGVLGFNFLKRPHTDTLILGNKIQRDVGNQSWLSESEIQSLINESGLNIQSIQGMKGVWGKNNRGWEHFSVLATK